VLAPLLDSTNILLKSYLDEGGTLRRISYETGMNYAWLRRFNQGKVPNPGVNTVQQLHDHLVIEDPGDGR